MLTLGHNGGQGPDYHSIEKEIIDFKKNLDKFINQKTRTPEMLHLLINEIEVLADGTIDIHYHFKEPTVPSV